MPAEVPDARYPALFAVGDGMAKAAQARLLALSAMQLAVPVISAALAFWNISATIIAIGIAFAVGTVVSFWLQARRPDREWFEGRALAESVKSLSWRFSMGVPPYEKALSEAQVRATVQQQYSALIHDIKVPASRLPSEGIGLATTAFIMETRALGPSERKARYIEQRLRDQQAWYRAKARQNELATRSWMTLVSGLQLVGLVLVGITIAGALSFNPFGLLGAVIGASVAWLQVRRHQEQADAYTAATVDLDLIAAVAPGIDGEEDLQKLVEDAENAMSREHTVWRAKRSVIH